MNKKVPIFNIFHNQKQLPNTCQLVHKLLYSEKFSKTFHFLLSTGSDIDPVSCFECYLSKLHSAREDLWQKPRAKITGFEENWYENTPVGRDTLNDAMKNLSKRANLSQIYTNHCIRATTVTNLNEKGFEARHIMATTGHKSETSIKSYATRCPDNKRRQMSDALAESMQKKQKSEPASTISVNPEKFEIQKEGTFDTNNDFVIEDIDIPDDQIADILTEIENENTSLVPQSKPQENIVNVSNVSNVKNVNMPLKSNLMPTMYFPNSNVTINYHIHQN